MVKPDRERYIWLYCHSVEDKKRYQELADVADIPLSKYLLGIIDDALAAREDPGNRAATVKELDALKEENKTLKEDLRMRRMLIERLEAENKKHKEAAFLNPSFTGMREYDSEIIEAIKNYGPIRTPRLLERLNIDPGDLDRIEALSRQIENLEAHGLVERSSNGWMWAK
jgi:hypothetical protein